MKLLKVENAGKKLVITGLLNTINMEVMELELVEDSNGKK